MIGKGWIVSSQMRLGDSELTSHTTAEFLAKIDAAQTLAGLKRLLFLPSHSAATNKAVIDHCRKQGIEVFLWYKVLADNDLIAEQSELVEDAWGRKGAGESGLWPHIFNSEETFYFGCPRNRKYNGLLLGRCRQMMEPYDGVMVDCIGFPLPSIGLEMQFSCFCPACLEDEPRLEEWRKAVFEMREALVSASDADLERWGTFKGILEHFGLGDLFQFRRRSITELSAQYAQLARDMDKVFALDVISPVMSLMSGHDYKALGEMAEWIKPRIYHRTYGPSSIPLELHCLTMGMKAWGRRLSIQAILECIERSTGLKMPKTVHALKDELLPSTVVANQIERAQGLTPCPIHPGLELSMHPEYDSGIDQCMIRSCLKKTRNSPGIVLCWNLIHIPDKYLRLVGELEHA